MVKTCTRSPKFAVFAELIFGDLKFGELAGNLLAVNVIHTCIFVVGTAGCIMMLPSIQVETMDVSLYSPTLERSSLLSQFLEMKPTTSA
jgi:hypothetical protein